MQLTKIFCWTLTNKMQLFLVAAVEESKTKLSKKEMKKLKKKVGVKPYFVLLDLKHLL